MPKRLEFHGGGADLGHLTILSPGSAVVAVLRDDQKIVCWRMDIAEAERTLADLNAAILRAIDVKG